MQAPIALLADASLRIHDYFTGLDWLVIFLYLGITTLVGHTMRGKQATISDFFAGGRTLPWMAVCGSIIATEISGVTFIGVAGSVLAANGDFGYMIWGIGSVIGRVVVGLVFVRVFFEDGVFSPYDYMGKRIHPGVKVLATAFFTVGSILGQSVRVLVAALPLTVVTGWSFSLCILTIGIFAVAWTLMGGMRTVIWTDVMQFFLFSFGGAIALFWIITHLEGGWSEFTSTAGEAGKFGWWNMDWGFGPALHYTFWVAVLAVPFQNLTAFGVDQLNAQRMFCCKSPQDAAKAVIWSSVGQLLTLLMLFVGAALFVWYLKHPPEGAVQSYLQFKDGVPKGVDGGDAVFPAWIVSELPPGMSGLILAGVFAAAISSLDSILAALSQTTVSVLHRPELAVNESQHRALMSKSKIWVVVWGLLLTAFTLLMRYAKEEMKIPILPLAFGMTAYTMGPLLGMFIAALLGKGSLRGLVIGSTVSFLLVVFVRLDVWVLVDRAGGDVSWLRHLPTYISTQGEAGAGFAVRPVLNFVWMWPLTFVITLFSGLAWPSKRKKVLLSDS